MNISTSTSDSQTVAMVTGEVDADNCTEFGESLLDTPSESDALVVDASGLTFIDSSGISELLRVRDAVAERGQRFELRHPSPAIRRVLEITGLLDHFGLS